MALESATFVSDLVTSNPPTGDDVSQGDDHLRLIKTALQATFPDASKAFQFPNALAKTATYSVLAGDAFTFFTGSSSGGAVDFNLPSLAAGDAGFFCVIRAIDITNALRIVPASGTINGTASFSFTSVDQTAIVWWSGATWYAFYQIPLDIHSTTEVTAPAVDDEAIVWDQSVTANRRITLQNLFEILNVFTEDATPDFSNDFLLSYDASASTVKKVKPISVSPVATSSVVGRVELADQTEMEAGSATDKAVTPQGVNWHIGVAKGLIKVNGSTGAIVGTAHNLTSARTGTGLYTITITTDFSSGNYFIFHQVFHTGGQNLIVTVLTQAAGSFTVRVERSDTGAAVDPDFLMFGVFGDQA